MLRFSMKGKGRAGGVSSTLLGMLALMASSALSAYAQTPSGEGYRWVKAYKKAPAGAYRMSPDLPTYA